MTDRYAVRSARIKPPANPLAAITLALCPALAISTHLIYALVMAAAVLLVLLGSNVIVTATRDLFAGESRAVAILVIVAGLVSLLDLVLQSYLPRISAELGIYVPLVAVSCIVLGRAGAQHQTVAAAAVDALAVGFRFAVALLAVSVVRELFGLGTLTLLPFGDFGGVIAVPGISRAPLRLMVLAPGAFLVVGYLLGLQNWLRDRAEQRLQAAESKAADYGAAP